MSEPAAELEAQVDPTDEKYLAAEEISEERAESVRTTSPQPLSTTTNAYANSLVVYSGLCRLLGFSGYSSRSSSQFILVFDANVVPASGAVPVIVATAAATSNFYGDFGSTLPVRFAGRVFYRGIVICNSSTAQTLTIGSADCWIDCQYATG